MFKKMGKIGLALVLVIGLLPMMSLRAYAAVPSFNEAADFVIEPPATGTTGKSISAAQGLQDGSIAVLLNSFVYQGNSYIISNYLRVYNSSGTLVTDVNLNSLMDTYYKMTDVTMLPLNNGNLLISYYKSDANENNVQLGTVTESTPIAYFMVLNKAGQKVTAQTKLNTFSDGTLPQLTRNVSATELSDGNIAFSWQRNDNVSTATRVFTAAGTPVSSETLLVDANASMSYVSAGDGVYMVAYNSGSPNDNIYLKLFSNNGALLNTITVGARTDEKQLYLSTLNNGNFMFSQYHWQTGSSEVSLYDNAGTSQGGFTVNGYMGEASAAVYRSGALPGFVTVSTDSASNDAINDAYYNGKDWSGTQYAYLNYYGYDGNLILTSAQPVDSAPVVMQGYDEQSWMYAVEYYPKFSLYPAFGDKVVFIKTDNTDASHYRITGKLFDNGAPPQGNHVFTVTNTNDSGAGSLRWAIEQAGAVSGGQVDFDPSLAGQTITLQSDLTGWNDQDWKGTTIGDASSGGFKLTGLQDATGHPAITINGNGHRGILATGSGVFEMSDIRLTGFDITDSSGKYDSFGSALGVGGNLYSSIQLNNVIFEANTMTYKKTGAIASLAALTAPYKVDLDRVVFTDNVLTATATTETTQGAALYYNSYMDGVISNSLFANNRSNSNSTEDSYGSAIGVMLDPHLKVWNNTFYNNHVNNTGTGASYGPAMYAVSSSPGSSSLDIYNNVLISNKLEAATAGTLEELFYNYNNDTLVQSGSNVISGDPFVDAAGGNFSLKGSAVSAIDQGDNTKTAGALDLAGGARIYGGTVDIGAYEYVPGPTVPVVLQSAVADGVPGTTTSTKIDLTFDAAITGLTADDITITDGTGSAVKGSLTGSGTAWSLALTSVTAEGDVSVAVNSPSGYTVSGSPLTANVSLFKPALEPTPAAVIDYAAEQLSGLTANGAYTVNGTAVTATADGTLALEQSWLGESLSIVKQGNASTTVDSAAQVLSIPSRPATPTGVTATDEMGIEANNGTLTNVTAAMEYKQGALGTWTDVTGTTVTGLAPGTYEVRVRLTASSFVSEAHSVTVNAYVPLAEPTPAAVIDYAAEQLSGLMANGLYTVNGTLSIHADAAGKLALDSSWLGTSLSLVKQGNASTTIDSAAQTVTIPARPAAPAGVTATDETAINAKNGTLTNVTPAMEYKQGAAGAWTDVTGTTVSGLAPGTYFVQTKATLTAFASEAHSVNVVAYVAIPEATPAAVIDYEAEQLSGLTANGMYILNGSLTVTADADGKLVLDNGWLGSSLSLVKQGNASTTIDSGAQTLTIPVRPAAPAGVAATDETAINAKNGTLTNMTTAMEYKKGTAGAWTDVPGTSVSGLAPDTYYVRTKGTVTAFASEAQAVTVSAYVPTPEATPAAVIDYEAEQLSGLTANGMYILNGSLTVTADADGKLALDDGWLGSSLSLVKQGNASTTVDSAAQSLTIPARPAAPADVASTDETAIQAKDGTLTNVTTAMEYRKGTAGPWTDVTGTTVTGLAPGVYEVRTKATATAFSSAAVEVTVTSFASAAEVTPAAVIDYTAERLTGLIPEGVYTVNGMAVTAATDGTLPLDSSWLGSVLNIVKTGDGVTTTDSDAQILSVPARQAAPVGVSVTDVTYNGANDGTLQNLTVQMEYQMGNTGAWTEVTDTTITGLAPGTYYVRVKATSTDFASAIAQVTVHDSDAVIPAAPEVVADDLNNTIVGLNTSMEFSVDDGPFVRYDGTNLPDLSGEHAVKVRVAASGSVPAGPATALTFTTNVLIPAGGLAVNASDPGGAESNGYTQIKVTPAPADGHKLLYKNFGSGSIIVPNVGDLLTGYTLVGSEGLIPAADGDTIGIAEVDAEDMVVKYGSVIAVVAVTTPVTPTPDPVSPGSGSNPNSGTPSGNAASTVTDVIVLVNGKEENAGKATTTISGNLRTTTIAVDPARLQAKLDAEGNGAVVTIPMMLDSNVIAGELSGQMIKNMENVAATLVLQTSKGSYTLPASEINIGALAARLGNGAKLEDITLRITIGDASAAMNQVVTAAASRGGLTLAAPILDFTVTASFGTSTVEVSRFNAYVSRTVALPQGVNPNRLTTGIVVDPDGTVRHVPTRIIQKDGKYYAEINSLTNSTYSVVWHPLTFADVEKHWAKNAVNDMGSRLVINGVNESTFNPNADITRAEFAAIIVRGLGLKLGEGAAKFADVPANSWYAGAVGTASGAGLITGFEDGSFRPGDRITREQAMNIIAKAMKLTGLAEQTGTVATAGVLAAFTDAGRIGTWAKDSLALAASAGLITGRGGNKLEAKANVTRAEVAVLIQRLLQKSELID
ncbi:S-layer homology domain-containing protein [Paenibacillus sp. FSL H3-0333]|uniref:S-layer homology domain-containing protein n=1 Tax=Paenibacillus sp. FSL H3-0333 TaxID=2921373 RepID=UPI0030F92DF3